MYQQGSLFIGQVELENTVYTGGVGHVYRTQWRGQGQLIGLGEPGIRRSGPQALERQVFGIGSKAFIEPNVLPGGAGHVVAEPLVGQLVGREGEGEKALRGHGLVLHAPAKGRHAMPVLLLMERV